MDVKSFGILNSHTSILKSYVFMCNYNIESKRVPEKKRLALN